MLSKMPDASSAKTESVPKKDWPRLWALPFILLGLLLIDFFFFGKTNTDCREYYRPDKQVVINNQSVHFEVADDETEREIGLSGRKCIDEKNGMIFSFEQPAPYCFWMKDMLFSIDIIWVGKDNTIVDIKPDVSPSSYPDSLCPQLPAKYVLELKSGQSQKLGLSIGSLLPL